MKRTYNMNDATPPDSGEFLREMALIAQEIKEQLTIIHVADKLGIVKKFKLQKKGTSFQGECPTGHSSSGGSCFSIDTEENLFNCFHCKEAGDIISLVQIVNKDSFYEAVKWLINAFIPSMQTRLDAIIANLPPEAIERYDRDKLYRAILEEGKNRLASPIGKTVMDYLVNDRGYDAALIPNTDFMYWDTVANIRTFLNAKYPELKEEILKLKLTGASGDIFRLAIPFKDRNGLITGFLKRAHSPKGFPVGNDIVRWDSTPGLKKSDLFGLHRIKKGQTELVVVEGYPDATYVPVLGMDNVVALGMAKFSNEYFYGLKAKGIKSIILALDNDGVGAVNSVEICQMFADSDIQVFVLEPTLLGTHKDPDEYIKANGIDAFKNLVHSAESGSKWYAKRLISKKNLTNDIERRDAIDSILEFAATMADPIAVKDMLDILVMSLQLTPELLEERYDHVRSKNAEVQFQQDLKEIFKQADTLIHNGESKKASKELSIRLPKLIIKYTNQNIDDEITLETFLAEKQKADSVRKPGSKLGYKLDRFPKLNDNLSGVQSGLYIIAADPNIGKTIFLVNLTVDLIKSNPDASLLFYTMDDSREAIINRFLAQLTGMEINYVQCAQSSQQEKQLLDDAYNLLTDWTKSERINIRESNSSLTMESIQDDIRDHQNSKKVIAVIDGLYNVPMQGKFGSIREENIERANKVKELVKLYKIPVIATAEVRKRDQSDKGKHGRTLHDIMETGKYGYNADVVLLLHPQDYILYRQQPNPIINVEFGKNKLSGFRDIVTMEFTKAIASYKETGVTYAAQEEVEEQ